MSKNKENKEHEELESQVRKSELILKLKQNELETLKAELEIRRFNNELKSMENPELTA
jgi:hypothetical protein